MLTVDDFAQVRQARRDGASIRALAKRFRHLPATILKVLAQTNGHQQKAAAKLGISRRTLSRKLKVYDSALTEARL